jgi:hypothetical protein
MRLLATTVACLALCAAAAAAGGSGRTLLQVYTPTGPVGTTDRGYCWTGSIGTGRANAWRCFIGHEIHDPCFATGPHETTVVCAVSPWDRSLTRIRLTQRLPLTSANPPGKPMRGEPWAVKLASGATCTKLQGAAGLVAGKPVSYGCSDRSTLLGRARRGRVWTIARAASFTAKTSRRVTIRVAVW